MANSYTLIIFDEGAFLMRVCAIFLCSFHTRFLGRLFLVCTVVPGGDDEPYALRTALGWGVIGRVCKSSNREDREKGVCNRVEVPRGGGGGGVLDISQGGEVRHVPHTLTLFKTNIADFPTHFKTEFQFLIPCLGHLTQFKTKIDKLIP